jgi:hypothetical protein
MFVVYFENLSTATAPARDVLVVDRLDVDVLDVANATFEDLTIGTRRLSIDRNGWKAGGTFDLDEDPGLRVQIAVELEPSTGQIQWRLQTIDAATGLPPADPFLGFLPPNTNPPSGQGSVSLRIRARSALATGTTIRNRATITFDTNAPIETDEWINTIDNSKPESRVEAFGAVDTFPVEVRWSGTDQGAGIRDYTIYSSTDDGPFEVWLGNTTETTAMFQGSTDHEYSFYSIARDHVGNVELPPNSPDAEITVRAVPADLIGGICGSGACGAGSTTAMILCLWCVSAQRLHSHRKHKEATPRMRRK